MGFVVGIGDHRPAGSLGVLAGTSHQVDVIPRMRAQHDMPSPKDRSLASVGHGLRRNDIDQFGCAHDDRFDVGASKRRLNGIRGQRKRFEISLGDVR